MRRRIRGTALACRVALITVGVVTMLATGETSAARGGNGGGGGGGGSQCPRTGIACADVYDPITCSNGVTYGNACYAYVACATGCPPAGGGPTSAE